MGLARALFLVLVLAFVVFIVYNAASQYPAWLIVLYGLLIALTHFKRSDRKFLRNFIRYEGMLMTAEYSIVSAPLIISLIIHQNFLHLAIFLCAIFTLSFLPPVQNRQIRSNILSSKIPKQAYEWKSGLREGSLIIVIVYFAAMATSFHPAAIPISIFVLSVFPLGYYEKGEPLHMLLAAEMPPGPFLLRKITTALKIYNLALLPLILIYLIFNLQYWYIPIIEVIIFSIIIVYMVMLKYAFYVPNEKSAASQVFLSLGVLSIFIPVLLPLMPVLTAYFYNKALKNLNPLMYDYH